MTVLPIIVTMGTVRLTAVMNQGVHESLRYDSICIYIYGVTEMTNFFCILSGRSSRARSTRRENSKTLNDMLTMMIGISQLYTVIFVYTFQLELYFCILFSLPYRKMLGGI